MSTISPFRQPGTAACAEVGTRASPTASRARAMRRASKSSPEGSVPNRTPAPSSDYETSLGGYRAQSPTLGNTPGGSSARALAPREGGDGGGLRATSPSAHYGAPSQVKALIWNTYSSRVGPVSGSPVVAPHRLL